MALLFAEKPPARSAADSIPVTNAWFGNVAGKLTIVFAALVLLHILYVFFHWGGEENKALISNIVSVVIYAVTSLYAWRTARHKLLINRSRLAWRFIALGNAAFLSGALLWTYFENYLGEQPFPSLADVGYLAYFPLMMAGLLLLVEPMKSAEERLGFAVDVAIIMIAGTLVVWYFLLQPLINAGDGLTLFTVLSVAYPVGDLVLLVGIVTILLRRRALSGNGPVTLVLIGVVGNFIADFIFGYQSLNGTYVTGDWVDAIWSVGCLPIVLGAHYLTLSTEQDYTAKPDSGEQHGAFVGLPYMAVAVAFVVLFLLQFDEAMSVTGLDIVVATVLTTLIVVRQFVFLRETTRVRAAVNDLQERIQGIYSASTDGIGIADFDGNLLEVNDAFARLLGYERGELTAGTTIFDLTTSQYHAVTVEVSARVISSQESVEYEQELLRKDGTTFTAQITVFPIGSPAGKPSAIAAIVRDVTGRKRSEDLLREAEERWQLALRVNRDGVWDWDLRNNKFYFSPRWREMFGYGPDVEIPFSLAHRTELFHPDDRHLSETIRKSLLNSASPYVDVEFRHRCEDESYRWIRCRAEAVIDHSTGRLERVVGLNTDISEKKRRDLESEAIGKILRGVSETSNLDELLVLVHESIATVIHARNCFVALHDKITGLFTMQFFIDEYDTAPLAENLDGTRSHYVFTTGRALLLDEQNTASFVSDGKFRLVGTQPKYWLGVPLRTPNEIIGVLVVQSYDDGHSYSERDLEFLKNIAGPIALAVERKRAENRMLLLNTALNAAVNSVVITDGAGNIEWVNKSFTGLTGYSANEAVGANTRILNSGRQSHEFYKDLWNTIQSGNPWQGELVNRRKDGRLYDEEMTITPLHDETSDTVHFIAIKSDITERKLAEAQLTLFNQKLQQSNRELQEFAYVASHDLQEPLRKVQTFADRLGSKYSSALDETGLDYLERMRNAASRMQTLIQDLLAFSRVTTKAQPFVPVDMEELTRGVLSDLEVKIDETGATIETDGLPVIDADPSQMRQLVQNLVGNALKFRREGFPPIVKICARPTEHGHSGGFEFTVQDNGIGFDEKYLDKIFTVFQRLQGRAEYEGSGIGLAVCRKIVERHHGSITARSTPGQGASFVFTLPARQAEAEVN